MSVQVGDIVKIKSETIATAIQEVLEKKELEAVVTEVSDDSYDHDIYTVQIKLPLLSFYEDEVVLLPRQRRAKF